jgi:endonuclease/exonuclease/phosphatase (EEP) superfamily protein YafD
VRDEADDPVWRGAVIATRVALGLVAAAALAPVVASLVLRQVHVDRPRLVAYVAGTPVVLAAGVVAIALFLLARSRIGTAVAAVLTAALLLTQVPLYLGTASAAAGSTPLRVMTLNMHYGGADADEIMATVRAHRVDVLATEEMTPAAVDALHAAGIDEVLPHQDLKPGGSASGNGLWSRYPLTHVHTPFPFGHPPTSTMLDYHGRPVFVSAVHPVSPYPSNAPEWSAEMGRIARWLGDVHGLGVVAGDFNATRDHRQFRDILDAGWEDAATQAGVGWQPTYPAKNRRGIPLLVAIDHVLVRGGIVATHVDRVAISGSDHAGLVATLMVPPAESVQG